MPNALEWIAAVGGVAATVGTWTGPLRARWQLQAEQIRNGRDRRENELHRMRHAQLYHWWHDMPDGPVRYKAMHWFGEWTGARDPYRGKADGAIPPGFGCRDAIEAYDRTIGLLDVIYHPRQPGLPPRQISPPPADEPGGQQGELSSGAPGVAGP
jgi:hypothetical protein